MQTQLKRLRLCSSESSFESLLGATVVASRRSHSQGREGGQRQTGQTQLESRGRERALDMEGTEGGRSRAACVSSSDFPFDSAVVREGEGGHR